MRFIVFFLCASVVVSFPLILSFKEELVFVILERFLREVSNISSLDHEVVTRKRSEELWRTQHSGIFRFAERGLDLFCESVFVVYVRGVFTLSESSIVGFFSSSVFFFFFLDGV